MALIDEIAKSVNGRYYGEEISTEIEDVANDNRIVIVLGASDDLMILQGAVSGELGAYNGATAYIHHTYGLINTHDAIGHCVRENPRCPLFMALLEECIVVTSSGSLPWTYTVNRPHALFEIHEEIGGVDEIYGHGIVFVLDEKGGAK